ITAAYSGRRVFNASSRKRSGSRSPPFASSIISFATAIARGSLRSVSFNARSVSSYAATRIFTSSGLKAPSYSRRKRIGTAGSSYLPAGRTHPVAEFSRAKRWRVDIEPLLDQASDLIACVDHVPNYPAKHADALVSEH